MLSSMINADYKVSNYCRKNAVFEKCYVISTCYSAIDDTIYNHLPGDNLWKLQIVYLLWSAYIIKKQRYNYKNEISLSLHWCFHTLSRASSEQTLHLIYHSKQKQNAYCLSGKCVNIPIIQLFRTFGNVWFKNHKRMLA